jgi:signal transduction histidine kinase
VTLPPEILATWPDRWRYPALLGRVDESGAATADELLAAVLDGLAEPVPTIGDAVRNLINDGDFAAAEDLIAAPPPDPNAADAWPGDLKALLRTAQQAAIAELRRIANELTERARRCGVPPPALTELTTAPPRSLRRARRRLDDEAAAIRAAEDELRAKLQRRLDTEWADAPTSGWRESVINCLEADEFETAAKQIDDGPWTEELAGPLGVPRLVRVWPWDNLLLPTVLRWYRGEEQPPLGFSRWHQPDNDSAQLFDALAAAVENLSAATVQGLAAALDMFLGGEEVRHPVDEVAGGFRTWLSCLNDPRLPHIGLPRRISLWIGPSGWTPPHEGGMGVWLRLDATSSPRSGLPRVAALGPTLFFRLAAPQGKQPTSRSNRRINLLREICGQLEPADLLPLDDRTGPVAGHNLRDDLAWTFDLLGVAVDGVVLDALIYDTGGAAHALWTAVDTLLANLHRPCPLTHDDLAQWRQDETARQRLRTAVLAPLSADPAAYATACIALQVYGNEPQLTFTASDLTEWLRDLDGSAARSTIDELVDVAAALPRTTSTGLVERHTADQYGLARIGLVALLIGDELEHLVATKLEDLRRDADHVMSEQRLDLVLTAQSASAHLVGNRVFAIQTSLLLIKRDLSAGNSSRVDAMLAHLHAIDEQRRQWERPKAAQLLRPELVDVGEILDELRRQIEMETGGMVVVERRGPEPGTGAFVRGRRPLLRIAFENVLQNAVQAIESRPAPDGDRLGRIRLGLTVADADDGRRVVIDVEDDGPGLPWNDIHKVREGLVFTNREGGQGQGLQHTRKNLQLDRGRLELVSLSADLGGAHFQIVLPYTAPDELSG